MKPHAVVIHVSDEQYSWLAAVAKGRRTVEREKEFLTGRGRPRKPSPAAVVVDLIDAGMEGDRPCVPSAAEVLTALEKPAEMIQPTILDIGPSMIQRLPAEDLAWAAERLHELLAALYGRVRRERLFLPAAVETPRRIASR